MVFFFAIFDSLDDSPSDWTSIRQSGTWRCSEPMEKWHLRFFTFFSPEVTFHTSTVILKIHLAENELWVQIGLKTLEGLKKWKSVNAIAATGTFFRFVRWSQLIIEISYFFINLHLRVHESDHSGPTSDPNLHHEAAATETFQNWAFAGAVVGASFFIFYTLSVLSIFRKKVFWSNVLRPSFWFCRWSPAGSSIHPP